MPSTGTNDKLYIINEKFASPNKYIINYNQSILGKSRPWRIDVNSVLPADCGTINGYGN